MNELLEAIREGGTDAVYLSIGAFLGVIWFLGVLIHTFLNYNKIDTSHVMLKLTGGTVGIVMFGPILLYLGLIVLIFYLLKLLFLDLPIEIIKAIKHKRELSISNYKVFDRE